MAADATRPFVSEEAAQSTLEYAIVLLVFLSIATGLSLLAHAAADGVLARIVEEALSHGFDLSGALDVALY